MHRLSKWVLARIEGVAFASPAALFMIELAAHRRCPSRQLTDGRVRRCTFEAGHAHRHAVVSERGFDYVWWS